MAKTLKDLPKWAQAEIEEIRLAGIRLWPSFEEPMPIETPYGKITKGWISYGESYPYVEMVDAEGGRKREIGSKYWSKIEGIDVYATRLEAIRAYRWKLAKETAKKIRTVEKMLEQEMDNERAGMA